MKYHLVLFSLTLMLASIMGMAQTAYITVLGNTVSVINVATNTVIDTITVGNVPVGVSVSANGSKVYIVNNGEGSVSVINTATNTVSATIVVGTYPGGVSVSPDGNKVYVANDGDSSISVINTATNTVSATIAVGVQPIGVSVSPDGSKVYVTNYYANTVSIINTATNTVSATIKVGNAPLGVSVSPDGNKVYVANDGDSSISVINTTTDTVSSSITVGSNPWGVSVSPDGSKVYVANNGDSSVSVINTATNTVSTTITVGNLPEGVSVTPDGSKVYVTNSISNTVSVINTATNTVSNTIMVGNYPISFGNFISTHTPSSGPTVNFQSSDSTICANDCINFTDLSTNATSWQWLFYGALDSTSAAQNPQNVCYAAAGTYSVKLVASNSGGIDSLTFNNYIKINPAPSAPSIRQSHDTLYCSTDSTYISYQWYSDSTLIGGATNSFYVTNQNGNYNIKVTNAYGCFIGVGTNITTGINEFTGNGIFSLYPNPATNQLTIHTSSFHDEAVTVSVMNVLGQIVSPPTAIQNRGEDSTIYIGNLPAGIYFLQMKSESRRVVKKFVKE